MSAITCQVLHRRDRVTFIWSQGTATFEPYVLAGSRMGGFYAKAEETQNRFREWLTASDDRAQQAVSLAQAGHGLYQALFDTDALVAKEVRDWLETQNRESLTCLDIATDLPGFIPWNLVYGPEPNAASLTSGKDGGWQGFWGLGYNLAVGRRANPLRQVVLSARPTAVVALDPRLGLSSDQVNRLRNAAGGAAVASAKEQLAAELKERSADLVYILATADPEGALLGDETLSGADLHDMLAAADPASAFPIVFLNVCDTRQSFGTWHLALAEASHHVPGLIAGEQPLPLDQAHAFGMAFLEEFLQGQKPVARMLRDLRARLGPASLAVSAFCPADLRFETDADVQEGPPPLPLPERPYRPLKPFDREDRPLFIGRELDIARGAAVLDQRDTSIVLLHGGSGVGKTSFVRAGLVPFLEDDGPGYLALRDRAPEDTPIPEKDNAILALRTSSDLAGQLAQALVAFCAQPYVFDTPTGRRVTVDLPALLANLIQPETPTAIRPGPAPLTPGEARTASAEPEHRPAVTTGAGLSAATVWASLQRDPELFGHIVAGLTESLPFELLITIEQGEDLITLVRQDEDRRRRQAALQMLASLAPASARCKVILSLRGEFLGPVLELAPAPANPPTWRPFYLAPLSSDQLVNAILLPTLAEAAPFSAEAPVQKYGFRFEEGLARTIVQEARAALQQEEESLAPLVQAVCGGLYDLAQERHLATVRAAELKTLGGIRGALARLADKRIKALPLTAADRKGLRELVLNLYCRQPDAVLTCALLPAAKVQEKWRGTSPVHEAVQAAAGPEANLLEVHNLLLGGKETLHVSLSHDALAQVGAQWQEEKRRAKVGRSRIIDTLWIAIPLMVLVGVASMVYSRRTGYQAGFGETEEFKKKIQEQVKEFTELYEEQLDMINWPLYQSNLAQARTAWENGNVLRMRQLLLGMQAYEGPGKSAGPTDLRGFEWYYLWRLANGHKYELLGHRGTVAAVAVSGDGTLVATAGADGIIKLWQLATGKEQATIAPGAEVHGVAFAPDGKRLASAGADGIIKLWDIPEGDDYLVIDKEQKSLAGHSGPVFALSFGKDGVLASAGKDKTVRLWDLAAGKEKHILTEHQDAVLALGFSRDGNVLASGGADRAVYTWDPSTGKKLKSLPDQAGAISALAVAPDGKTLAFAASQNDHGVPMGRIHFWDMASGKKLSSGASHSLEVFSLAYAPDGKSIASAAKDHAIRLWDVATGKQADVIKGHVGWVRALAFAPSGAYLISGSYDASAKVWPVADARQPEHVQAPAPVLALALSPDETTLAAACTDGSVGFWDVASGRSLGALPGKRDAVTALAFMPKDKAFQLAVGLDDADGSIQLWEISSTKKVLRFREGATLKGHANGVLCLAADAAGGRFASGGADGDIKLWDTEGKLQRSFKGHTGAVTCLLFRTLGKNLVSGGADNTVRLWNTGAGDQIGPPLQAHTAPVLSLASLLGERILVSAAADATVKIWNLIAEEGPTVARTLRGHTGAVTALAGSAASESIFSGSSDGTVRLWSAARGDERFLLTGHTAPVRALLATKNRQTMVSAGNDAAIRFWRAVPEGSVSEPFPKAKPKQQVFED